MHDVEKIREEIMTRPNTGYCNILSNEVYRIIYGDKKEKEEIPFHMIPFLLFLYLMRIVQIRV